MTDSGSDKLQIEFPCDFSFKAFGPNSDDFGVRVRLAVATVVDVPLDAIRARPSSQGKYQCVTVLVRLHNREQLDAIYLALRQVEGLLYLV